MQNQSVTSNSERSDSQRLCPNCGNVNHDWVRTCARCGSELPGRKVAAQAELGHVLYVLHRLTDWQSRSLLPPSVAERLNNETLERQHSLLADLSAMQSRSSSASGPEAPVVSAAPPLVPPMPPEFTTATPVPGLTPAGRVQNWAARTGVSPIISPVPPVPPLSSTLRIFLQKYAIQTLFLFAAILVLTALRSMIAWEAVGAIAIRLIPVVPLSMTWMFWSFGQRTRDENPWAAFIYHALAAALTAFDLIAIHRYWLGSLLLTTKPMFLLTSGVAMGTAGWLLRREKRLPYFHLFQAGLLTFLFAALQFVRLLLLNAADFRVLPLPLFCVSYLLLAVIYFSISRSLHSADAMGQNGSGTREIVREPGVRQEWASCWTLWAHLSVLAIVLLCALDIALQEKIGLSEYGLIALMTGALYGFTAQMLNAPRMVPVSGGLLILSGGLWLSGHEMTGETGFGDLLLAVSAIGVVLAAYNGKRPKRMAVELATAWTRLAQVAVSVATVLVCSGLLTRLSVFMGVQTWRENPHASVLAVFCSVFLLGFAWQERQPTFVYAALSSFGVAIVRTLFWLDMPPYAFSLSLAVYGSLLYGLALQFVQKSPQGVTTAFSLSEWSESFAWCGFIALLLALTERSLAFCTGSDPWHLTVSLWPMLIAFVLIAATRRLLGRDTLRTLALVMAQITAALDVGSLCGLTQGISHWTASGMSVWGLSLVALAWIWWGIGRTLDRKQNDVWGEGIAHGGLTTAFCATLITSGAALMIAPPSVGSWWRWQITLLGAFSLFACDIYRTRQETFVLPLLTVTGLSGLISALHFTDVPFVAATWTLFALLAAGITLLLAHRLESIRVARLSWLPFYGGYTLLALLRTLHPLFGTDRLVTDIVWIAGGIGMAFAYLGTARWSEVKEFTYSAALILCGVYLRAVIWIWQPRPEWHALLLLPFLLALYIAGTRFALKQDALFGQPLRRTAVLLSGLALLWSAEHGDGSLLALRAASTGIVTLTLGTYGVAYTLLSVYRRTPPTVGMGATTLTLAYVHQLLTVSPALTGVSAPEILSWSKFAFYTVQAGLLWLVAGWFICARLKSRELASPLLFLAGSIALFSAVIAVSLVLEAHQESHWTILMLVCGGMVWFGLWMQDQGEVCLHVGTWNLLIAWSLLLYSKIGWEASLLDIYLLPFGLYLVAIGHRSSREQRDGASLFWWIGLLLLFTPSFLAFWNRMPGWHTVLLIIECLAAIAWGLAQRIRAFVSAGLLFALLFGASVAIGHLPDHVGTLASLTIGVGLFAAGYYALTHREAVQRWMSALERQWRAWKAWR